MPRISSFYGLEIAMHFNDHPPPHFHVGHDGREAVVSFNGDVIQGRLPPRAARLVREWLLAHRFELYKNWARARAGRPLVRIEPLR